MKIKLLFLVTSLCISLTLNAQTIRFISVPTTVEIGSTISIGYEYTIAADGYIYCAIELLDDLEWVSDVASAELNPALVGTNTRGTFNLTIPSGTIPSADLTGSLNYKIKIELKNSTSEFQAGEFPNTQIELTATATFYYGADLSYVNEMEDCGAIYKNSDGVIKDPYNIFKDAGANLIRVRLWHNPSWTNYSNFEDVKRTISRAKALNIDVLLDFHYSDTWADPEHQEIPLAWEDELGNTNKLGDSLYNYTYTTLNNLANANLLPDIVQIGNEINPMILQQGELQWPIDWTRNSSLIKRGIEAVRNISEERNKDIGVMLHIAQPENALWWFEQATQNGLVDFDWIGLSYYPKWSTYTLENISEPLRTLINTYNKRLMVVETAYPFTLNNVDGASNLLNSEGLLSGYPATEQGQLNYLNRLKEVIEESGGEGLIYWEPAWVSTSCYTRWGQGSHWDNATLFDSDKVANLGMQFYNASLTLNAQTISSTVPASVEVGADLSIRYTYTNPDAGIVYIGVELHNGNGWVSSVPSASYTLNPAISGTNNDDITISIPSTTIPTIDLASGEKYKVSVKLVDSSWGTLNAEHLKDIEIIAGLTAGLEDINVNSLTNVYPNPVSDILIIKNTDVSELKSFQITDISGRILIHQNNDKKINSIDVSGLSQGVYFLITDTNKQFKFLKK